MLPYVNLKWNVICKDTTEELKENIKCYTLKELMQELGQTNITRFKNDLLIIIILILVYIIVILV